MNDYLLKIKLLAPTLLITTLSSIVGLAIFRWVFTIHYNIIDIPEEIWGYWIPVSLSGIIIILCLKNKFKIFINPKLSDETKPRFALLFLIWIYFSILLIISQAYLETSSYSLIQLNNIDEIEQSDNNKYFKIDNFSIANTYGGSHTHISYSGKYNQQQYFSIYFVIPIFNKNKTNHPIVPKYWYSKKFISKSFSNKLSNIERNKQISKFFIESAKEMDSLNYYNFEYFEKVQNSFELENYHNAIKSRIGQTTRNNFIVLKPIKEKFEHRNGKKIEWFIGIYILGFGLFLLFIKFAKHDKHLLNQYIKTSTYKQDNIDKILRYFIPSKTHFISSIFLDITSIVFVIFFFLRNNIFHTNKNELLEWGALQKEELYNGELYRLITNLFIHSSYIHFLVDIFGWIIIAGFVEKIIGYKKLWISSLIIGVLSNLISITLESNILCIGSTNIIMGIIGIQLIFLSKQINTPPIKSGLFLILICTFLSIILISSLTGHTNISANISGFIVGISIGFILFNNYEWKKLF
ncbi:MAG TPA: rhomboid family intramembrane serine protease [Chitinophagales bacterium]|nr:rhomboid family intramembrane serine protease [Chitinophagales bacterium]HMU98758.1 rhomboid family intramembrane serine protease [Chitinophagales bacterium]HMV02360.1 rhomboid family intramembrane serine protease [Chitinophagales bacterium]HMW94466.1 rhomboid family intramembrane serine protease [Chitinophagales bacterium]HMY42898.1 rhomboid family intramembrane serine protease [Chitinophagales bacterium]